MIKWLHEHKFEAHFGAFTLMILASIGMYITTVAGVSGLIWPLLGVFILANFIAMAVK